jgi:chaperonin cofactor prefoldin
LDGLDSEQVEIQERMAALKKILYGRFGKSINLEDK